MCLEFACGDHKNILGPEQTIARAICATEMPTSIISQLQSFVGEDGVISDADELLVYECDAYTLEKRLPQLVVLPRSTDEVVAIVKLCAQNNIPIIGTIINKKSGDNTEMHNYDIKQLLETPVIGSIPADKEIKRSVKLAHPVVHANPNAPSSINFKKIASHLLGQSYKTNLQPKKQTFSQWFIKALTN